MKNSVKLDIIPFNVESASEQDWKKFHIFRRKRHEEAQPNDPVVPDQDYQKILLIPPTRTKVLRFNVFESNNPDLQVADIYFSYFTSGHDMDTAMVNLGVLANHRHKGIGFKLYCKILELAKEFGKSRIMLQSIEEEGMKAIEHFGAEKISDKEQFRLAIEDINWQVVDKWLEQTENIANKVKIEWLSKIPDEVMDQYARIYTTALDEHPKWHISKLKNFPVVTPEMITHDFEQFTAKGGKWIIGIIREKNGDISGLTELKWTPIRPEKLLQFITHIKLKYRGKGRGKLLKASAIKYITKEFPNIKSIQTGFVGEKEKPLFKINEQLGFKLFFHTATYEINIANLEDWIKSHS